MDNRMSKSKQLCIQQGDDRFSNLPEGILHYIFSFLPTLDAVRTTVLSSRWNRFWVSLTTLDFDEVRETENHPDVSFIDFVDRVFYLRDSVKIHKLQLHIDSQTMQLINNWLMVASWRDVVDLDICIDVDVSPTFPSCLFSCKSLQRLSLGYIISSTLIIPDSVCFPSLKFLFLYVVPGEDFEYDFITRLVSRCPVLQEFEIKGLIWDVPKFELNILSSTLTRIMIDIEANFSINIFRDCSILISSPNLNYLEVSANIGTRLSVLSPSVTEKVSINVGYFGRSSNYEDAEDEYFTNLMNIHRHPICALQIISEVSHARDLTLSGDIMKILIPASKKALPTFHNLTHLDIVIPIGCGLQLLLEFLKNSASLRTLVLRKEFTKAVTVKEFELRPSDLLLDCPLLHLEIVEMKEFIGEDQELELIKYLLKNALVLKKLIIQSRTLVLEKDTFRRHVLSFPAASTTCLIDFQ